MLVNRNEDTAELVGLSFGDGGLTYRSNSNRVKFQLRGDMREEKENYDNHIAPLFNKEIMKPLFNRDVGFVYNIKKNFYGISVESVKIEEPLNYLGIPSGVKKEINIPNWIKSDKVYLVRFLRGFFDTDGTIFCSRNYSIKDNKYHTQIKIGMTSISKDLIKDIYEALLSLGFKCFFQEYQPLENKDGFIRQKSYTIKISGGIQVEKWFREIGSKSQKHTTKYQIWKEFGFCPPYTTLEERKRILKNQLSPHNYYMRGCQSGQMDDVKAVVA